MDTIKLLMPIITAVVSLLLAWFVGNRISVEWGLRQKKKETDLLLQCGVARSLLPSNSMGQDAEGPAYELLDSDR